MDYFGTFFCILAGVCVFILLVICGGLGVTYHVDKNRCHAYAAQTSRPTKFVRYTFATWDCLTPSTDGKWIPVSQLREVTK